jgi:hypothetical protein
LCLPPSLLLGKPSPGFCLLSFMLLPQPFELCFAAQTFLFFSETLFFLSAPFLFCLARLPGLLIFPDMSRVTF